MTAAPRYLEFIYLPLFERTTKSVLSMEDMRKLENELLEFPTKGAVVAGTGGVRKVRMSIQGYGKSGSARVVYLYVAVRSKVYFIFAYPKNVQGTLTEAQKKIIRELVARIEQEAR